MSEYVPREYLPPKSSAQLIQLIRDALDPRKAIGNPLLPNCTWEFIPTDEHGKFMDGPPRAVVCKSKDRYSISNIANTSQISLHVRKEVVDFFANEGYIISFRQDSYFRTWDVTINVCKT